MRKQDGDARLAMAEPPPSLDGYDVVLLASPIWNIRPPMIMQTFAEALDFYREDSPPRHDTRHEQPRYRRMRPRRRLPRRATLAEGLAVEGEEVADVGDAVDRWLRRFRSQRALSLGVCRKAATVRGHDLALGILPFTTHGHRH